MQLPFGKQTSVKDYTMPSSKLNTLSQYDFRLIVQESNSWLELGQKLGYKKPSITLGGNGPFHIDSGAKRGIKKRCLKLDICFKHLKDGHVLRTKKQSDLLPPLRHKKDGTTYRRQDPRRHQRILTRHLEKADRLYICEYCRCENMELKDGNWHWHGKVLKLQIDHVKGVDISTSDAHDVDSLAWTCSNCHSQRFNSNNRVKSLQDTPYNTQTVYVKNIVNSGRQYVCQECNCHDMYMYNGHWHWQDWPIKLEVNHKNGRNIDNPHNIDNLSWNCPNCHWIHTTNTRNKRREEKMGN